MNRCRQLVLQNRWPGFMVLDDVLLDLDFLVLDDPGFGPFCCPATAFSAFGTTDLVLQSLESHFHLLDDWC